MRDPELEAVTRHRRRKIKAGSTSSERSITQQLVSAPPGAQQTPHAGRHLLPRAVKTALTNKPTRILPEPSDSFHSQLFLPPPPLRSSMRLLRNQIGPSKNAAAELDAGSDGGEESGSFRVPGL